MKVNVIASESFLAFNEWKKLITNYNKEFPDGLLKNLLFSSIIFLLGKETKTHEQKLTFRRNASRVYKTDKIE